MADGTNELVHELLRRVHLGSTRSTQADTHNIYNTLYRQDDRLDRIDKRLDLRELAEARATFSRDT